MQLARDALFKSGNLQAGCILRVAGVCATEPLPLAAPILLATVKSDAVQSLPGNVDAYSKLCSGGRKGSSYELLPLLQRVCDAAAALCAAAEGAFLAGEFPQKQYSILSMTTLAIADLCIHFLHWSERAGSRNPAGVSMPSQYCVTHPC